MKTIVITGTSSGIGKMEVTRAFLPHLRANKAGLFLNVSPIGGASYLSLHQLVSQH